MNKTTNQPFLCGSDRSKVMRILLSAWLVTAAMTLSAADGSASSQITGHPLADVRAVMEAFCAQAPTNVALRGFTSSIFHTGPAHAMTNRLGETGIRIAIIDCNTISPSYEISATSVSLQTTRLEVNSIDVSPDEYLSRFRPKRNARVMAELVRLLEKKP